MYEVGLAVTPPWRCHAALNMVSDTVAEATGGPEFRLGVPVGSRPAGVYGSAFSDQKSRGFHIHKSHISDPQRLSRLLIAVCLAYIWIVYLGALCEKEGWREHIHRKKRCDLSLFQLGLRILEHFLNEELPIPVQFHVTI